MRILVKVKPRAREERVEKLEGEFMVWVKEPPAEGRANQAVIRALADYFNVASQDIRILSGKTSRHKIVEINH